MDNPTYAAGAVVGRFRLLARIGEGGMGVVHLAEDASGRRVALKVLRPQVVGDDESRQRLAREVSSLRHVHSRHVAEVLDADPWGALPYVVTRYVPGHSLAETVRRDGPLLPADLLHVAEVLLAAVRDVHAAGVLHRDLKPTNVVMEGRSPVLIDFGLARLAEDPRLTMTGWLLGTPGYLAPEMLFGEEATPATDVHGWAATIAYAATGRPPYGTGHAMAVLDRTRRGEVDLTGAPELLRALLAACLVVAPVDRPRVDEVAGRLRDLAAADRPTALLASALPVAAGPPDRTLPWQLVAHEAPVTDVLPVAAPVARPTSSRPAAPAQLAAPARPPEPPTRPYTVVAPVPAAAGPQVGPATAAGQPLSAGGRLRRGLLLLTLLAFVAEAFRAAPYAAAAGLAMAVLVMRTVAFGQEAAWRRRTRRGPRWSDAPRTVLGSPWHLLRALPGSALLLGTAAVVAGAVLLAGMASGRPGRDALLLAGAVAGYLAWWGPAGGRVRRPSTQVATWVVRRPALGWTVVVVLALLAAGAGVAVLQGPVSWTPSGAAPWQGLRELAGTLVAVR